MTLAYHLQETKDTDKQMLQVPAIKWNESAFSYKSEEKMNNSAKKQHNIDNVSLEP